MIKIISLLFILMMSLQTQAHDILVDAQIYPAGIITSAGYVFEMSDHSYLGAHIGFNKTDRQDFGENDNEKGEGWGIGLSYRAKTPYLLENFFWGTRLDVWDLTIDWENQGVEGQTEIIVWQPTAEIGLFWSLSSHIQLLTSIALGVEVNTNQNGRDVGEGAIGLFRLGLSF